MATEAPAAAAAVPAAAEDPPADSGDAEDPVAAAAAAEAVAEAISEVEAAVTGGAVGEESEAAKEDDGVAAAEPPAEEEEEDEKVTEEDKWNTMVRLVRLEEADLQALTAGGIHTTNDLELFAGGATFAAFASDSISKITLQKLNIVATYLVNDGDITSPEITLREMTQYNLAMASGKTKGTRKRKLRKPVVKSRKKAAGPKRTKPFFVPAAATPSKRPRGRPRKNPIPSASKSVRSSPSQTVEQYRGKPKVPLAGGWPSGWVQVDSYLPKCKRNDKKFLTPGGKQLRSMVEVKKFLKALKMSKVGGDEEKAWNVFKTVEL